MTLRSFKKKKKGCGRKSQVSLDVVRAMGRGGRQLQLINLQFFITQCKRASRRSGISY